MQRTELRLPGYAFAAPGLLAQALTHRSAAALHNERLEFLGDALVNLIVAEALYQLQPKADEGTLTRARAELVRESSLATIARSMTGLHSAGDAFTIVDGAGLPRLTVIGHNRRVDWPTLVERLEAVGSGDVSPVVE